VFPRAAVFIVFVFPPTVSPPPLLSLGCSSLCHHVVIVVMIIDVVDILVIVIVVIWFFPTIRVASSIFVLWVVAVTSVAIDTTRSDMKSIPNQFDRFLVLWRRIHRVFCLGRNRGVSDRTCGARVYSVISSGLLVGMSVCGYVKLTSTTVNRRIAIIVACMVKFPYERRMAPCTQYLVIGHSDRVVGSILLVCMLPDFGRCCYCLCNML
jgi:hypothetical protein